MENHVAYERALARAKAEGCVIAGDSVAPNGSRAWSVFNPKHTDGGWYTVRMAAGSNQLTCNCVAGSHCKPCKHQALVQEALNTQPRMNWLAQMAQRRNPAAPISLWS